MPLPIEDAWLPATPRAPPMTHLPTPGQATCFRIPPSDRGTQLEIHSSLNQGLDLRIPPTYMTDENQRLRAYKRMAQAADAKEREKVERELADRYGPVPADVLALLKYSGLKTAAEKIGIEAVDRKHSM